MAQGHHHQFPLVDSDPRVCTLYFCQTSGEHAVDQAFEDGSDEQVLLKLHHRTNLLIQTIREIDGSVELTGLATATAPVLKAWVDNTRKTILRWMISATSQESWERSSEASHHSVSVVDVFASAHQVKFTMPNVPFSTVHPPVTFQGVCMWLHTAIVPCSSEASQRDGAKKMFLSLCLFACCNVCFNVDTMHACDTNVKQLL
jgi:hypothetical protein